MQQSLIRILICFIFCLNIAHSQTLKFSPHEMKSKMAINLMERYADGYWAYQETEGGMGMSGDYLNYNLEMMPGKLYNRHTVEPSPSYFLSVSFWNNKFNYLYESYKKKYYRLYLGREGAEPLFIDSILYSPSFINTELLSFASKGYDFIPLEDKKSFLLIHNTYYSKNKKEGGIEKAYIIRDGGTSPDSVFDLKKPEIPPEMEGEMVFDYKFGKLISQTHVLDPLTDLTEHRKIKLRRISGNKSLEATDTNRKRSKLKTSQLKYTFTDMKTGKEAKLEIPGIEGSYYHSFNTTYGEDHSVTVSGLYVSADKKAKFYPGYYSYSIDMETAVLKRSIITPLNAPGLAQFEVIRSVKGEKRTVSDFIEMSDGSKLCIIECYSPGPAGDYRMMGNMPVNYFNIYVLSFDKEGNYQWAVEINRKTTIKEGNILTYQSVPRFFNDTYNAFVGKDQVHIYFNDEEQAWDYAFSEKGKISTKSLNALAGADVKKFVLFPQGGMQVSDTEMLIPCHKNDKSTLVKISY